MEPDSKVAKFVVAIAVVWLFLLSIAALLMQGRGEVPPAASSLTCVDAGVDAGEGEEKR